MSLENPLWDYALELYRQPGVEQACLGLQQKGGLSINRLLFCCWLAGEGRRLRADELEASDAARWQRELTAPLRALRYQVREQKRREDGLEVVYRALRQAELAAEQVELARLFSLGTRWPAERAIDRPALLLCNIVGYLRQAGVAADACLADDLEILLCAAQPALDRTAVRLLRW
ncbi:TIGR02444 family protein [Marinobacterium aestuariivivens]|uniref:TIGR02444 family protein n=1 Tax=Marinobacterium aestuariivivens TaxID=1698799 RepID=A0ABW2A0D6_9GAMM